ncbi:endo-1,3;1,4-beta-D-glucanase-like isoform X2 [Salvia splendens]|uniref:endo-1,3;1,4-beta-D-glucanase-like isoform X2 n=1 Tax=Salvia splendens TaxID=180675 RepID=UPI001C27FBE5|nr:endo-1,3;1,4-beta-D-glucanase-like isoform X2 [Salvia splendens]
MSGAQCCENPPALNSASGNGKVEEFGGLSSYISGPANSKAAVILISDVFGYEAPHLRKIADKVGAAGFRGVVPDFFHGDPYVPDQKPITEWLKDHGPDQGFEDAKPVIEALKSKGITKIGGVGFCWGAKVVVELSKHPYIQAAVLIHPSFVSLEDIQAELDDMCPPELVKQFEAALNANPEVDSFVKIFSGCSHGWTVRYNDEDEEGVKKAEEAQKDMLDWFVKYLN